MVYDLIFNVTGTIRGVLVAYLHFSAEKVEHQIWKNKRYVILKNAMCLLVGFRIEVIRKLCLLGIKFVRFVSYVYLKLVEQYHVIIIHSLCWYCFCEIFSCYQ